MLKKYSRPLLVALILAVGQAAQLGASGRDTNVFSPIQACAIGIVIGSTITCVQTASLETGASTVTGGIPPKAEQPPPPGGGAAAKA